MSNSRAAHPRRTLTAVLTAAVVGGALVVLLPGSALANGNDHGNDHGNGGNARSVIFINGDGMSAAHREAARLALAGFDGDLVMNTLGATGLETTDPRNPASATGTPGATITDSAAAATAWATGQKTYNGAISVDVNGTPLTTLGAEAKAAGKATGIVTTAQVTDASPAAFFSSVTNRDSQDEIARQYLEVTKPDVILGGGEDRWLPATDQGAFPPYAAGGAADPEVSTSTKGDLVAEAQQQGYQYVTSAAGLQSAKKDKLLGLFANEEMFQQRAEGQGDVYAPVVPLKDMTSKALQTLSKDRDGFFLFVEEEGIDEFSHSNNATQVLATMKALDDTVALARDYVKAHPDTLLIVTGDHDCGGLTVEGVDTADESGTTPGSVSSEDGPFAVAKTPAGNKQQFFMDWTTTGHTGVPTVVTGTGYASDQLVGYYPNTHLHDVMRQVLLGRR